MSRKITPEGQHLNVAAMAWWRANRHRYLTGSLISYYNEPATRALVEACADLHAAQEQALAEKQNCPPTCEFRDVRHAHGARLYEPLPLQHGAQGEELDSDTSAGGVEQQ